MTDLLDGGLAWLDDQRHRHMARMVTYRRGGQVVQLRATVGRTVHEELDEYGAARRHESRDFLVRVGDLVLGGEAIQPSAGDQIIMNGVTYEVMSLAGEGPWRWSDPYRRTLRIHTKEVLQA